MSRDTSTSEPGSSSPPPSQYKIKSKLIKKFFNEPVEALDLRLTKAEETFSVETWVGNPLTEVKQEDDFPPQTIKVEIPLDYSEVELVQPENQPPPWFIHKPPPDDEAGGEELGEMTHLMSRLPQVSPHALPVSATNIQHVILNPSHDALKRRSYYSRFSPYQKNRDLSFYQENLPFLQSQKHLSVPSGYHMPSGPFKSYPHFSLCPGAIRGHTQPPLSPEPSRRRQLHSVSPGSYMRNPQPPQSPETFETQQPPLSPQLIWRYQQQNLSPEPFRKHQQPHLSPDPFRHQHSHLSPDPLRGHHQHHLSPDPFRRNQEPHLSPEPFKRHQEPLLSPGHTSRHEQSPLSSVTSRRPPISPNFIYTAQTSSYKTGNSWLSDDPPQTRLRQTDESHQSNLWSLSENLYESSRRKSVIENLSSYLDTESSWPHPPCGSNSSWPTSESAMQLTSRRTSGPDRKLERLPASLSISQQICLPASQSISQQTKHQLGMLDQRISLAEDSSYQENPLFTDTQKSSHSPRSPVSPVSPPKLKPYAMHPQTLQFNRKSPDCSPRNLYSGVLANKNQMLLPENPKLSTFWISPSQEYLRRSPQEDQFLCDRQDEAQRKSSVIVKLNSDPIKSELMDVKDPSLERIRPDQQSQDDDIFQRSWLSLQASARENMFFKSKTGPMRLGLMNNIRHPYLPDRGMSCFPFKDSSRPRHTPPTKERIHQGQPDPPRLDNPENTDSSDPPIFNPSSPGEVVSTSSSTVLHEADEDDDKSGDQSKGKRGRPRKHAPKIPLPPLYVFIRNLLHSPAYNPSVVSWVDEGTGCFKVTSTTEFARTWGKMKSNRSEEMNYEKMSRAMRYHYGSERQGRKGHLAMVKEKRLYYRFGELAVNWRRSEIGDLISGCCLHDICRNNICLWSKE